MQGVMNDKKGINELMNDKPIQIRPHSMRSCRLKVN